MPKQILFAPVFFTSPRPVLRIRFSLSPGQASRYQCEAGRFAGKNESIKPENMSSISSVSSATAPYQPVNQLAQDFDGVASALQTGNLAGAQSALATFQQALKQSTQADGSQPFGSNSQANTDYQTLASDLQTGDLSGAQKAFGSLKKDLTTIQASPSKQSAQIVHHHHQHSGTAAAASIAASTSAAASTTNPAGGLNQIA